MADLENMRLWLNEAAKAGSRGAMPILSAPGAGLIGVSLRALTEDSDLQADAIAAVAGRCKALAAVGLMDLSVEAEAFGSDVHFAEDEIPTVTGRLVEDEEGVKALSVPPVGAGRTAVYIDAIRKAAERISDRPVFAGMIGPYSLAARLFGVSDSMIACYDEPETMELLLSKATEFLIAYALAYKETGARGILMAEPVAGMLSPMLEEEFSAPYVKQIVDAVQDDQFLVIYHNCGDNASRMLPSILSTGAAAYHFGNAVDMSEVLSKVPEEVIVMGNLDPVGELFSGNAESVRKGTCALLELKCGRNNFILSSGCDIPPKAPWENIDAFFAASNEM